MAKDKAERESGKSFSSLVVIAGCAVSLLIGLVGGVLTGPYIKAALGIEQNNLSVVEAEPTTQPAVVEDPSSLFAPMPGVFSPDKERFYADAGEFLVAIKYQGRTRYLQLIALVKALTATLSQAQAQVGHSRSILWVRWRRTFQRSETVSQYFLHSKILVKFLL